MLGKSTHLHVIPQQSTQNTILPLQTCKNKPVDFFLLYNTGVDFSYRNNFANLGSLAKVSVPVQFIIPWYYELKSLWLGCYLLD